MHECNVDACTKLLAAATARLSARVRGAPAQAARSSAELRSHHACTFFSSVSHALPGRRLPCTCRKYAAAMLVSPCLAALRGTQGSPLRCSALRGCPGACCACRSATTGLSKLRCHSMQRCFQHLVFCVQRSSHMRHQWLALKTGTQSTLRHDMSSCRVMPEAMHGHSRHAPRHCALMRAVEGVRMGLTGSLRTAKHV